MRLRILKALLWLVCVTHLSMGIAGVCSSSLAVEVAKAKLELAKAQLASWLAI